MAIKVRLIDTCFVCLEPTTPWWGSIAEPGHYFACTGGGLFVHGDTTSQKGSGRQWRSKTCHIPCMLSTATPNSYLSTSQDAILLMAGFNNHVYRISGI